LEQLNLAVSKALAGRASKNIFQSSGASERQGGPVTGTLTLAEPPFCGLKALALVSLRLPMAMAFEKGDDYWALK